MAKIEPGQPMDMLLLSKLDAEIGDYQWSNLDIDTFNNEKIGTWKLCDGSDCTGTRYSTVTGQTTVPNALTDGAFLRQAKAGRSIGSFEAHLVGRHRHWISGALYDDGNMSHSQDNAQYHGLAADAGSYSNYDRLYNFGRYCAYSDEKEGALPGGEHAETHPNNIAANLYIKVDY